MAVIVASIVNEAPGAFLRVEVENYRLCEPVCRVVALVTRFAFHRWNEVVKMQTTHSKPYRSPVCQVMLCQEASQATSLLSELHFCFCEAGYKGILVSKAY